MPLGLQQGKCFCISKKIWDTALTLSLHSDLKMERVVENLTSTRRQIRSNECANSAWCVSKIVKMKMFENHSYKLIFYSLIPDQRNETAKTSSTSFNISGETSYLIFGFSISPLPLFGTAGASSPSFEKRFGCQTPRQWYRLSSIWVSPQANTSN